MTFIAVRCLHGDSEQIVKHGKTHRGTQRVVYLSPADKYHRPTRRLAQEQKVL
jgi:hypothetical protein